MPLKGAWSSSSLIENAALRPVMASLGVDDDGAEYDQFTVISSLSDAPNQHWHRGTNT